MILKSFTDIRDVPEPLMMMMIHLGMLIRSSSFYYKKYDLKCLVEKIYAFQTPDQLADKNQKAILDGVEMRVKIFTTRVVYAAIFIAATVPLSAMLESYPEHRMLYR